MTRYLGIWGALVRAALQAETQFRASFVAKLFRNAGWLVFVLAATLVIFGNADQIGGWNKGESLALVATLFLVSAINNMFFHSLSEIPQHVRTGTLDFFLSKPVDSQFWVSVRRFNVGELGSFIAAIILLVYGLRGSEVSPLAVGGYVIGIACGVALYYSMNLVLMTLGIWLVRVDNLWVLTETISGVARYPLDMYGAGVRRLLVTWVPLGLLAYAPASMLVKGFDGGTVATSVAWALFAVVGSRMFWRRATRSYSSASS